MASRRHWLLQVVAATAGRRPTSSYSGICLRSGLNGFSSIAKRKIWGSCRVRGKLRFSWWIADPEVHVPCLAVVRFYQLDVTNEMRSPAPCMSPTSSSSPRKISTSSFLSTRTMRSLATPDMLTMRSTWLAQTLGRHGSVNIKLLPRWSRCDRADCTYCRKSSMRKWRNCTFEHSVRSFHSEWRSMPKKSEVRAHQMARKLRGKFTPQKKKPS